MSLQVVRVLIGIFVSVGKIHSRIRTVIIEPAFHLTFNTHNYLQFFVDLVFLPPQSLVVLRGFSPQPFTDLVFLTSLIIFSFAEKPDGFSDENIMCGFLRFIPERLKYGYLTRILVAFALPETRSAILYLADAIMTSVPALTASFMYSSLAFAPFAPAREAPRQ